MKMGQLRCFTGIRNPCYAAFWLVTQVSSQEALAEPFGFAQGRLWGTISVRLLTAKSAKNCRKGREERPGGEDDDP